jgi:hypothetical protein
MPRWAWEIGVIPMLGYVAIYACFFPDALNGYGPLEEGHG